MISFQIKPWVAFGLPYLLIESFYIGMPVVRTVGRLVYGHMITKFSSMGRLPHFVSYGAPPRVEIRYYGALRMQNFQDGGEGREISQVTCFVF